MLALHAPIAKQGHSTMVVTHDYNEAHALRMWRDILSQCATTTTGDKIATPLFLSRSGSVAQKIMTLVSVIILGLHICMYI